MNNWRTLLLCTFLISTSSVVVCAKQNSVLLSESFGADDAVLVSTLNNHVIHTWQAAKPLVPASLSKLATAYLAIEKWGLDHRFKTDFYLHQNVLWVKGYGDPFIVSEELDLIAKELSSRIELSKLNAIYIDASHFRVSKVPGRSTVNDPYNAPLSAVSANFNTTNLRMVAGRIESAEPQTPLTQTAKSLASNVVNKKERINLLNRQNAQTNFAELLVLKMGLQSLTTKVDQIIPVNLEPVYVHTNSHTLADVLRGTLEFSNNFMANQVFLQLAKSAPFEFSSAQQMAEGQLAQDFNFKGHVLREGSGLSRQNRLSAIQIDSLLKSLQPHKSLFKRIANDRAVIHAKTGTLDGVRSYAGYIDFADVGYRFVFVFNRSVPWRYREQLLDKLVKQLEVL